MADEAFRAAVAFDNLADRPSTTVRASSNAPFLPVQLLRDPHINRPWRGLTQAENLRLDFTSTEFVDTVALMGCNVTGSVRLRSSLTDPNCETNLSADIVQEGGDLRYRYQIMLLPEPVAARFLRIDLAGAARAVEAGRLFVGLRQTFRINFAYGWSMTLVDPSRKSKSAGGNLHVDRKRKYRMLDLNFEHVPDDQRWGFVEDLDHLVGGTDDFLMLSHPLEVNHGQRAIWGTMPEPAPNPESYFNGFAKAYRIEERL